MLVCFSSGKNQVKHGVSMVSGLFAEWYVKMRHILEQNFASFLSFGDFYFGSFRKDGLTGNRRKKTVRDRVTRMVVLTYREECHAGGICEIPEKLHEGARVRCQMAVFHALFWGFGILRTALETALYRRDPSARWPVGRFRPDRFTLPTRWFWSTFSASL